MATNRWRVATNPSILSDDEIDAIKDADRLVLSLAPSPPAAIPRTVTFCQVIGTMHRVWLPPKNNHPSCDYMTSWIDLDATDNGPINWNVVGRDHPQNIEILKQAMLRARPYRSADRASGDARQLTESMRDFLERETSMFLRLHGYYFHHLMIKVYVVQVFEKHAWGIRFLVRGRINGVERTLISVPALAHLSLDLATVVPSIKHRTKYSISIHWRGLFNTRSRPAQARKRKIVSHISSQELETTSDGTTTSRLISSVRSQLVPPFGMLDTCADAAPAAISHEKVLSFYGEMDTPEITYFLAVQILNDCGEYCASLGVLPPHWRPLVKLLPWYRKGNKAVQHLAGIAIAQEGRNDDGYPVGELTAEVSNQLIAGSDTVSSPESDDEGHTQASNRAAINHISKNVASKVAAASYYTRGVASAHKACALIDDRSAVGGGIDGFLVARSTHTCRALPVPEYAGNQSISA
ncbi:hypothetical protein FOMPIDRAFT_93609 [Fomitopsis schrenkii]|uniref:Uncharacterized protein n=1 Tax=Fomitopsis schrenkii TaxID=2126942 RepID=S8DKA2_FOMSC|nr:hypothetical protein FOMPIDRAFT_93609 [Fomitopsis schrenkii]